MKVEGNIWDLLVSRKLPCRTDGQTDGANA